MLNKLNKRKEGFTIIEVLIVLAIAGVIMLVVFLAVPALQRNARNNQRRSDVSHLGGIVNEYAANHQGQLPTDAQLVTAVGNDNFAAMTKPATGGNTVIAGVGVIGGSTTKMEVHTSTVCDTNPASATVNQPTATGASARSFSIHYKIQSAGADADACQNG